MHIVIAFLRRRRRTTASPTWSRDNTPPAQRAYMPDTQAQKGHLQACPLHYIYDTHVRAGISPMVIPADGLPWRNGGTFALGHREKALEKHAGGRVKTMFFLESYRGFPAYTRQDGHPAYCPVPVLLHVCIAAGCACLATHAVNTPALFFYGLIQIPASWGGLSMPGAGADRRWLLWWKRSRTASCFPQRRRPS